LLSKNSGSRVLGLSGTNSSFSFSGPSRGVLPISPNDIRGLGALQPPPLSDAATNASRFSYNYTFDHQGLTSNISCIYINQSPITFLLVPDNTALVTVTASCNDLGMAPIIQDYQVLATVGVVASWACEANPTGGQDPAYYFYLRELSGPGYDPTLRGNISCTIASIQPAVFPVTYQSSTGAFSTQNRITTSSPANAFSNVIGYEILTLARVVQLAQTISSNLVASIVKEGFQGSSELLLYEAMIQGILEDPVCTANNSSVPLLMVVPQVTILRFSYSSLLTPPPESCNREVNGTLSIEEFGWVAKPVHIGFLMPLTILNLASLIIMSISIARAKKDCHEFDVTDPRSLVLASRV